MSVASLLSLFALLVIAYANTEKIIFTAPDALGLPDTGPALHDLRLISLTPAKTKVRASLPISFEGEESWYLLQELYEGQRYELRVCWAASQPTSFSINEYSLPHVFDTPHLIQSLSNYSETRQNSGAVSTQEGPLVTSQSVRFLHIHSTADYFTTNQTLMRSPPPVDVDIILDPYLWNIVPWSLIPTGVYIIATAIAAWVVSGAVWRRLFSPLGKKQRND